MTGQSHRERDHYETRYKLRPMWRKHNQSGFGGEAFALLRLRRFGSFRIYCFVYFWLHFVSNLGLNVPFLSRAFPYLPLCTVPACDIRGHGELTGGSSGHVSVDLPQIGGREME